MLVLTCWVSPQGTHDPGNVFAACPPVNVAVSGDVLHRNFILGTSDESYCIPCANALRELSIVLMHLLLGFRSWWRAAELTACVLIGVDVFAGDSVLGYDLAKANLVHMDFEAHVNKGGAVPDVILVRKSYEERRRKHRHRAWKLRHLDIEMGEER